ncbi:hypothetical protein BURKHO8Y_210566 [Burkholderia sp. 8Y]|nr:hypothetical protein BURKHO8Y_210566 [Burkholderia sp. 8Y]
MSVRQRQEVQELSRQARITNCPIDKRGKRRSNASFVFAEPGTRCAARPAFHGAPGLPGGVSLSQRAGACEPALATFSESRTWLSTSPRSIPPRFIRSQASR